MKNVFSLFVLFLLLAGIAPTANGQLSPIAIAGWITLEDDSPAISASVTVLNVNTGEYANTTTNAGGQYATTMSGSNDDIIRVNCTHLGDAGVGMTTVNLANVTHWVNLSLSSIVPPVALFTYTQYDLDGILIPNGQKVVFHDYSTDADGAVVGWNWLFGDGHTSLGKSPEHIYDRDGTYRVTLTVIDNEGLTDNMSKTLRVEIGTPEKNITIPPPQPPRHPLSPYTIPEMYQLLRGDKLQTTSKEIIVVVVDTGTTPRMFNNTDMNDIIALYHPSYKNGLDDQGHGTFTNCIVHYALEQWAPNSVQYSIKALDENGQCSPTVFLESLDMAKNLNPHIVTVSAGTVGRPGDVYCHKIDELRREGIIVTVAAGNLGPTESTILSPACGKSAVAIGAIDPRRTVIDRDDDKVAMWSSRGPVPDIYPKPDMVSPGESIYGPYKYGEIVSSGTSFSTPFVAGGAMLLYANNKFMLDLVKTIYGSFGMKYLPAQIVEESLAETCFDKGSTSSYGWGIVDIEGANEKVFWKCLLLVILFIAIIIVIIVIIIVVYWLYRKQKQKPVPTKKTTKVTSNYL